MQLRKVLLFAYDKGLLYAVGPFLFPIRDTEIVFVVVRLALGPRAAQYDESKILV